MGHGYHTPFSQVSRVIAEEGAERLSEPEVMDSHTEAVFSGCIPAAVAQCLCPTQKTPASPGQTRTLCAVEGGQESPGFGN